MAIETRGEKARAKKRGRDKSKRLNNAVAESVFFGALWEQRKYALRTDVQNCGKNSVLHLMQYLPFLSSNRYVKAAQRGVPMSVKSKSLKTNIFSDTYCTHTN